MKQRIKMGWSSPGRGEVHLDGKSCRAFPSEMGWTVCFGRWWVWLEELEERTHSVSRGARVGVRRAPGGHSGPFQEVERVSWRARRVSWWVCDSLPRAQARNPGLRHALCSVSLHKPHSLRALLYPHERTVPLDGLWDPLPALATMILWFSKIWGLHFWLKGPGGNRKPRPTGRKMSDYGLAQLRLMEPL